jgi:hypothetical protein
MYSGTAKIFDTRSYNGRLIQKQHTKKLEIIFRNSFHLMTNQAHDTGQKFQIWLPLY